MVLPSRSQRRPMEVLQHLMRPGSGYSLDPVKCHFCSSCCWAASPLGASHEILTEKPEAKLPAAL